MNKYKNFKKNFGQNFLRSDENIELFVKQIEPKNTDFIVEIGPGDGALTEKLLESGASVLCIEVDTELIPLLNDKFKDKTNFKLINKDILDIDIDSILDEIYTDESRIKIVGSLPYNISKKIIRIFLDCFDKCKIFSMHFLIQKEVAEDYTAMPPRSKFLYLMSRCYAEISYNFSISKKFFYPEPKVDGAVITFKPNVFLDDAISVYFSNLGINEKYEYIKLLKQSFMNPRKTLMNNLKHLELKSDELILLGIHKFTRPSEIELDTWIKLYEQIKRK